MGPWTYCGNGADIADVEVLAFDGSRDTQGKVDGLAGAIDSDRNHLVLIYTRRAGST